ncbi:MAG TPA: ribonuclease HII [Thermoplasmata archaeon]|nr:ribonuclease HII [Thermoplasmata archaeon]
MPAPRTGRWVLGLDEAGRGSVLGPLVIGGFLAPEERLNELPSLGVRDSKQLNARTRLEVYGRLAHVGECASVSFSPAQIDPWVRRGGLNRLEALGFAQLVRRLQPHRVVVDASDPVAERFGREVERLSGSGARVEARHHADEEVPVVSGASIVAKVRRDEAIARLERRVGRPIGSGYPSDERTVRALEEELGVAGSAPWIRHSWVTTQRVKARLPVKPLEAYGP